MSVLSALRAAFREYVHDAACTECGAHRMAVSMMAEARLLDAARSAVEAYDVAREAELAAYRKGYVEIMAAVCPPRFVEVKQHEQQRTEETGRGNDEVGRGHGAGPDA
jgi:hypothetical protein